MIGLGTDFLTDTHGTGIAHHVFEGYEPWAGDLRTRPTGSLVADRTGAATSDAMFNLQERGTLFHEPTTEVYVGMIVGERTRVPTCASRSRRMQCASQGRPRRHRPGQAPRASRDA